jgi:hypothetical protein
VKHFYLTLPGYYAVVLPALPLAVGITHSESTSALTCLFECIKSILPEDCFYKRGRVQGPMLVMTDDSAAEQAALRNVWPQSVFETRLSFLCQTFKFSFYV